MSTFNVPTATAIKAGSSGQTCRPVTVDSIVCRYTGTDPSMMVTNALFRMGGAAVLLSNRCVALHLSLTVCLKVKGERWKR